MTMTTAACATAVALHAGTACFAVPAAAQGAPVWRHPKPSSANSRKLFMSAVAEYEAGLRRDRENSTNNAYLRGFRDGTSSEAYSSRAYAGALLRTNVRCRTQLIHINAARLSLPQS